MPDGRTKRKDGTVGFRVGKFIHSNERMAEIARSSAAQLEYNKRREERARFLAPQTIQATEGVTKVPNTIVDGVEFSPDGASAGEGLFAAAWLAPNARTVHGRCPGTVDG